MNWLLLLEINCTHVMICCKFVLACVNFDILLCVFLVSITMYYDEEHSKLFTAFNQQVMRRYVLLSSATLLLAFTLKFGLSVISFIIRAVYVNCTL